MANKGAIRRSATGKGSIEITSGRRRKAGPARSGAARRAPASGLESVFSAALKAVEDHREELNALDEHNGNHGDNMVYNMRLINQTLSAHPDRPPADRLRAAAEALQRQGQGGTGRYYALGLARAAEQVEGREQLGQNELLGLVQTLLGTVPAQGYPEPQAQATGGSVLESLLGSLLGGSGVPSSGAGGGLLESLLGVATGAMAQQRGGEGGGGLDVGDLVNVGLSLLGGGQAGGGSMANVLQTILGALAGGGGRAYSSPREASGSLILQGVLQALLGGR